MPSVTTPFKEAEDFLRQKIRLPTKTWTDISHGMHARAFVSAGAVEAGLLEDLHQAVIKAVAGGVTRRQFREQFDQILAGRGWPFNAPDSKGYRDWRAGVIYDTNLRMAYQAGHWKQMQETADSRPYLEYSAILDSRTRPLHREWHGTILPIDHPWWKTHYPPNGWNCRCTVISRSAADLKRLGKAVSVPPPSPMVDAAVSIDGQRQTIQVPEGIDPGFDYNVGEAAWGGGRQALEPLALKPEDWRPLARFGQARTMPADAGPVPNPVAPMAALDAPIGDTPDLSQALTARFKAMLGGQEAIFTDPTGGRVLVTDALAKHYLPKDPVRRENRVRLLPLLPETIERPQEIWMGFDVAVNGLVRLRRRYLRLVEVEIDGQIARLTVAVDSRSGQPTAITFFGADSDSNLNNRVRTGLRVYKGSGEK